MRLKFKIWHLLLMTFVAAFAATSMVKRESFPYPTVEAASRHNSGLRRGYQIVEYKGDMEGPFNSIFSFVEGVPVDKTAKPMGSMSVRYQVDGVNKAYQVPNDDRIITIVSVFENPKGNHLLWFFREFSG